MWYSELKTHFLFILTSICIQIRNYYNHKIKSTSGISCFGMLYSQFDYIFENVYVLLCYLYIYFLNVRLFSDHTIKRTINHNLIKLEIHLDTDKKGYRLGLSAYSLRGGGTKQYFPRLLL